MAQHSSSEKKHWTGRGGHRGNQSRRGPKRSPRNPDDEMGEENDELLVDASSPIIQAFLQHQKELDSRYDKYERLVKRSRDITIESKRIIFLLHRMKGNEDKEKILSEAAGRLKDLQKTLLRDLAEELINEDPHQYVRAYSAGVQEFVEALTFYHYEKDNRLLSLEEMTAELESNILSLPEKSAASTPKDVTVQVHMLIQPSDYILGIADLTGELMRKCIMAIGAGHVDMPFQLCKFLRQIHDGFVSIGNLGPREVSRKIYTLKQSLTKVETACYTLQVRGSEIPKHMLVDVFTRDTRHYPEDVEVMDD